MNTTSPLLSGLNSVHERQAAVYYKVKPVVQSGHSCNKHLQPVGPQITA